MTIESDLEKARAAHKTAWERLQQLEELRPMIAQPMPCSGCRKTIYSDVVPSYCPECWEKRRRPKMNEATWLASEDPQEMLRFIAGDGSGPGEGPNLVPVSARKLRLFVCACCRQVWDESWCCVKCGSVPADKVYEAEGGGHGHSWCWRRVNQVGGLTDPRSRRAVEVAERFADGEATGQEMVSAREGITVSDTVGIAVCDNPGVVVPVYISDLNRLLSPATQATLLRCIFGNPFQSVTTTHEWPANATDQPGYPAASWLTLAVLGLAQAIYDARRFEDLPVLADALEEAGCTDPAVLDHCRGPGPHARGCWALDLLLSKE